MKQKKFFILAAALASFVACSESDIAEQQLTKAESDVGTVRFDAYTQRTTTRAGYSKADMSNEQLHKGGFGVFAYYTDNRDYDQLAVPNFMYNTRVYDDPWTYSPVMYWPNEYGNSAISDDADKVTFFAYAPYVEVTPTTGKTVVSSSAQTAYETAKTTYETAKNTYEALSDRSSGSSTWDAAKTAWWTTAKTAWATAQQNYSAAGGGDFGITGMTRNTTAGDPIVKYIGSFNAAQSVDLLWGVCQQSDWQLVEGGQAQKIKLGTPWLDVQRPADAVDQKLKFQFLHALAKMQITIDEYNDGYKPAADAAHDLDAKTRIWIRSVRFTGFTMKGALNLNNEAANEPYWMNYNGIGDLVADNDLTVYDGRKDGKEGMEGATATNEKVLGLNEKFIEDNSCYDYKLDATKPYATAWADAPTGVDRQTAPLFEGGGIFYVIPTGDAMQVEIIYDVETIDPNLGTHLADGKTPGSSIENRITKTIEFGNGIKILDSGKAYSIHLHLGMNSVKFDAEVVDWEDMASPDIDLPANMPQYVATSVNQKMEIPGAEISTVFAITGLKGGEAITAQTTNLPGVGADDIFVHSSSKFPSTADKCDKRANASGVVYVKLTGITPNKTIQDVSQITGPTDITVSLTGAFTTIQPIKVTQKAQPLKLKKSATVSTAAGITTFQLSSDRDTWANIIGTVATYDTFKVWCDGALLTNVDGGDPADEGHVGVDIANGTIKFNYKPTENQVIKVTIKAGDVPEETVSFKGTGAAL